MAEPAYTGLNDAAGTSTSAPGLWLGQRQTRIGVGALWSLACVVLVVVAAITGPLLAPHDPNAPNLSLGLVSPSSAHWLGTDNLGRDILSRLIVGARTALVGPCVVACGAMAIGNALGLAAGYFGGLTDMLVMRWVDLMYALPALLVAIVVVGDVGGGYWVGVCVLVALTAPYDTRLVRAATLEQRPRAYVEAARTLGLSPTRIMAFQVWPNISALVAANTFLNFAFALVSLSALSFLGIGVGPGTPDWGRMLAENEAIVFQNPAAVIAPALLIIFTAASMNALGDRLYEWLASRGRAL